MSFFQVAFAVGVLGGVVITLASRRVVLGLLWFWAAGVVYFTFGTASGGGQALNLALLDVTNKADIVDFILNMIMFAPGGALLAVLRIRWFRAGLFGLLGSLAIEVTQYLTASGRTADINDLLGNTLGCLLGFACAAGVRRLLSDR